MDNLTYRYDWADPSSKTGLKSNRLYHVNDQVNSTEIGPDIKDMGTFDSQNLTTANFQYDADGNIISDKSEGIKEIKWNAIGKVTEINRDENFVSNIQPDIEFKYDGSGRRICKIVKPRIVSYVDPSQTILIGNWIYTYYIHDAKGNEIASYEAKMTESDAFEFILKEHDVYGSSRIATINENKRIATNTENILIKQTNRTLGNKHFELTNHLGSVINVITDRKIPIPDALNTTKVAFFQAQTISQADYYPFGMSINSRTSNLESYGFAYNGMKLDNEISGAGNSYTAEFWQYDSRLGRRWNQDPVVKNWESSYATFANNPIWLVDPNGADTLDFNKKGEITKVSKGGKDLFRVFNENGGLKDSKTFDKKVLQYNWKYKKDKSIDVLQINGNKNGEDLFKFLAENTDVEWGFVATKRGNSQNAFLTTSHDEGTNIGSSTLFENKLIKEEYNILFDAHSHPGDDPTPSGVDYLHEGFEVKKPGEHGDTGYSKKVTEKYIEKYGQNANPIIFMIYRSKSKKYSQFDKNGTVK